MSPPDLFPFDWRQERAKHYAGSDMAWREQLQRNQNPLLSIAWAHSLAAPEVGCTLLANPAHTFSEAESPLMNGAVLFVTEHCAEGSRALVLNRPIFYNLGEFGVAGLGSPLAEMPMYLGGEDGLEQAVSVLHRFPRLKGSKQLIPGVCQGAFLSEIESMIETGVSKPEDFKFFLRYKEWGPGQLEEEVKSETWWAAACSSEITMKGCIQLPVPLWRESCRLLGGKYSLIAREIYDDL